MGRQSTFNEHQANRFVDAIRTSGMVTSACRRSGLSKATVYRWLERGDTGEEPFAGFLRRVQEARADVEDTLRDKALTDPRTATWFLERLFPNDYGMRDKVEQAAAEQVQALMDTIVGELSDGAREELLAALSRHVGSGSIASSAVEAGAPAAGEDDGGQVGGEARLLPASTDR